MNKLSLWKLDDTTPILFIIFGDTVIEYNNIKFTGFPLDHEFKIKKWEFLSKEMEKLYE